MYRMFHYATVPSSVDHQLLAQSRFDIWATLPTLLGSIRLIARKTCWGPAYIVVWHYVK